MIKDRQIYLDYQASTPVDDLVLSEIVRYYGMYFGNPHAKEHKFGWDAAAGLDDVTLRLATFLECDCDEIIYTSGATEAANLAILGLAARAKSRRRILVGATEHKCVLEASRVARERFGCRVEIVRTDRDGVIDLEELGKLVDEDVLLVSAMMVNNETGTIAPYEDISTLCAKAGALFHTDAAQGLAAGPVTVPRLGADLISLSGHKIYGPKGIGCLYVRRDVQALVEPQIVGGDQQRGMRAGTVPVPLCAGLTKAVELLSGPEATQERKRVGALRDRFTQCLLELNSVRLNGPPLHTRHPGNCNLLFKGYDARDLLERMQPGLAASTGSACTSGAMEPSHVLRAIGLTSTDAESSIRFSFGRFTTEAETEEAVRVVQKTLLAA